MYTEELSTGSIVSTTAAIRAPVSLGATGVVSGEYVFMKRAKIRRLMLMISTVTVGGPAVVTFYKRITFGSDTGRVVLGTLSVPAATAVTKVMYKDIREVIAKAGDSIICEVTTANTSGAGIFGFEAILAPEDPRNEPNQVLSA